MGPGILESLKNFTEEDDADSSRGIDELEHEVVLRFEEILEEQRAGRQGAQPTAPAIPTFFKPKPDPNSLTSLIKSHARERKEQLKHELADEAPLRQIGYLVEEYGILQGDEVRINYDGFTQVATRCREMFGPGLSGVFKASVFQMFQQDGEGAISARHFLMYLSLRSAMIQMRVHLGRFDPDNTGILTEAQLEDFLEAYAAEVPALEAMPPDFMPLYRKIAARKLMFFHGHNGSVRIRDLLSSHTLGELSDLKIPNQTEDQMLGTWFSLQSTMRVHNTFMRLDETSRGVLNIAEFSQISGNTMSPLFLERIFEEHVVTRRGQAGTRDMMDLLDFTDFVLAWDHRSSPAAIKYFFPIFDLKKNGKVSPLELYTFFKEIHVMWVNVLGEYADLAIYDVVDELLDMIKPKEQPCITQEDLRVSGMSGIFFSILADAKQFRDYNYRENQMHSDDSS
ncbi:hypothetical protein FOA52_007568 [Chlamydomonas sp. UWO 241]|nr:hypothetical protein FOA52_007568 [Chlamydomonas sp. UWO 241]